MFDANECHREETSAYWPTVVIHHGQFLDVPIMTTAAVARNTAISMDIATTAPIAATCWMHMMRSARPNVSDGLLVSEQSVFDRKYIDLQIEDQSWQHEWGIPQGQA